MFTLQINIPKLNVVQGNLQGYHGQLGRVFNVLHAVTMVTIVIIHNKLNEKKEDLMLSIVLRCTARVTWYCIREVEKCKTAVTMVT